MWTQSDGQLLAIWAQWEGCHDALARSVLGVESKEDRGTHTMPVSFLEKELN